MQNLIVVVCVGLMGGVAVGLQDPLSSMMGERLGTLESVFIVHFGGTVLSLLPLLALGGGNLAKWQSVPWYALGAGALGVVFISALSYAIPRIGVTATVTLVIAGQLVLGVIVDHFGLLGAKVNPLDIMRIIGVIVVFIGAWLVVR